MSDDIKVSVLTPIYNHKIEYVRQCLDSLHAQTMQDIEFILIDNGATKESKDLISEYEQMDTRFRVIHLKENQGYGGAMNAGLDAARGEYIGIVESDDYAEPNMYEKLYSIAEKYPNVDIIKCNTCCFSKEKKVKCRLLPAIFEERVLDSSNIPEYAIAGATIWAGIYKKDCISKFGFVSDKNIVFPDLIFHLKAYFLSKYIYLCNDYLLNYRIDNLNSSVNQGKYTAFNILGTLEYLSKDFLDKNENVYINKIVCKRIYKLFMDHVDKLNILSKAIYLKRVSLILKKCHRKGIISSEFFNNSEIRRCKKIALHPILYALFHKKKSKDVYIKKKKYLCGIITKKYTKDRKKLYICGIQVYTKKIDNFAMQNKNFDYNCLRKEVRSEIIYTNMILQQHKKVFTPYKNIFKNRDIVIVAGGPSASKYTNQIDGAIHIALNKAFRNNNIKFDFIFMQDYYAVQDYILETADYDCVKFFGTFVPPYHKNLIIPEHIIEKCNAYQYYSNAPFDTIYKDIDCAPLMDFSSVSFPAIHFALYTGAKRIFLVGCDCSSDGYSDGTKQSALSLSCIKECHKNMFKGYKLVKEFAMRNYPETEIISINPVNLKGYFKDIYTDGNNQLHLDEYTAEEVYCVN